jgi:hypothetical protein
MLAPRGASQRQEREPVENALATLAPCWDAWELLSNSHVQGARRSFVPVLFLNSIIPALKSKEVRSIACSYGCDLTSTMKKTISTSSYLIDLSSSIISGHLQPATLLEEHSGKTRKRSQ